VVTGAILLLFSYGADPRFILHNERNFFGVVRVMNDPQDHLRLMVHGTTVHGIESTDARRRGEPLSYYHRSGPIGQVFAVFSGPDAKKDVAVIGLGAGSLAGYVNSGQTLTFYEIDPAVERIARDTRYFSFLKSCEDRGVPLKVVLGDARLQLARTHGPYGLLVLDAFSSDSVPVHLITREAVDVYLQNLADDGVLAFNISTRYFLLAPVLATLAESADLVCYGQEDYNIAPAEDRYGKRASEWVVMARQREHLATLIRDPRWKQLHGKPSQRVWTDDYSNLLSAFVWRDPLSRQGP
jgi:hypothetical protein